MQRRSFLKTLGFATSGISLLAPEIFARPTPVVRGVRIRGKVSSGKNGIPRVAVTDGFSVVQTDKEGNYDLFADASRDFVYISLPSGYDIPQLPNGSAAFFQPIKKGVGEMIANFSLKKSAVNDHRHSLLLLADTQIEDDYEAQQLLTVAAPDIKNVADSLSGQVIGIGCGDLVFDKLEFFSQYNQAISNIGVPFFQVVGNHDLDLNAPNDSASIQTFKSLFGPNYYSFNRGEVHYIVLDSVFFTGNRKYIGYLSDDQLAWLEQDLRLLTPGQTVIVALHIPLVTGAVTRYPSDNHISNTVANREFVYKLLEPFKTHILSGHTHFNDNVIHGNIFEHNHGTVCGAWWSGPICFDGTPNGFGVYEINGSSVSWRYKATGFDFGYQARAYNRGFHPEFKEYASANVWNWDPSWKVFWYEDGIRKGEMLRIVSEDPLSIRLHAGPNLPQRRKWVDPVLTDHMFYCNPDPSAREVLVEVKDQFNRTYTCKFDG